MAARFVDWLGKTSRPWLVVLDDLRDAADLEGLWPSGPAGRVLITTANPAALAGEPQVLALPVPVFSTREAMGYLSGRLSTDPDQRSGAIDLVGDLGCEPIALAQASALIARTGRYKAYPVIGTVVAAAAALLLSTMTTGTSLILLSGFDQPLVLLVLSACLNGIVMFIYSILLIKLNRTGLPEAVKVKGFRLGALGFAVLFYGFFAGWYVITQIGELV